MRVKNINTDITIVGGGIAGVISAISAANKDIRVILIEKNHFLGGITTASQLGEMNATSKNGKNYLSETGKKIITNLKKEKTALLFKNEPMTSNPQIKVDRIRYNGEYLKIILDKMIREKGIEVFFNSNVSEIDIINKNQVKSSIVTNYEKINIKSKLLVDATGNAECIYLLKGQTIVNKKKKNQPATLIFRVGGVDINKVKNINMHNLHNIILKGYSQGTLPGKILALSEIPGTSEITVNATRSININHESVQDISEALMKTRKQIYDITVFLRENLEGFKNVYISSIGSHIGIRDRRRITGVYELKGEDIIKGKKFSDAIAIGIYPVDIHKNKNGAVEFTEIEGNGFYTIPYQSLITREFNNVIVTGKGIAADNVAFGSIRVHGTVMNIAEATGTAAYLAIRQNKNFKEIDIIELQNILKNKGMNI